MPLKRPISTSPTPRAGKSTKSDVPEDFSSSVKKRLLSNTRTGQACDRCKVRKIRCDGLPGGCSPCLQNNTECRTTDRITGRATSRGYVEGLEQQNRDMENQIREMEAHMARHGLDAKRTNGYPRSDYSSGSHGADLWSGYSHSSGPLSSTSETFRTLPAFRVGGDGYLGVSLGNSFLSSIKGTALSILGMEVDIADFDSVDMDEPDSTVFHPALYNKSYQAFLQTSFNINPRIEKLDLPPREEGITYATWYFRVINPYTPTLHKPTFMATLLRMYDDPNFRPTVAEDVIVHMVFAIMFFQYATRNWEDTAEQTKLTNQSNMFYHYSLGKFYLLSVSHTVQDVQALTMICQHLRNFPKPGASWFLTMTTLSLAIELGLHRSAKKWSAEHTPNVLDVEMRKRTFWAILAVHVTLSGKLGRPMALRWEDFDCEIPEPIDDDLISEAGLDISRPGTCRHQIGIQAWKLIPYFIEMYNKLYSVRRRPQTYMETVTSLESKIRAWRDALPPELTKGEAGENEQEGRVFALYAQSWALELKLLLRHPSVSMTNDAKFNAESLRICIESARQLLVVVRQLQKLKSLDTTWYNTSVFVMAITTTLFAQWARREEITYADLSALREEMDMWLDIMGDVGCLLGSGQRLREAVRVVTEGTLGLLHRSIQNKNASAHHTIKQEPATRSPLRITAPPAKPGITFTTPIYNGSFSNHGSSNGAATNSSNSTTGFLSHSHENAQVPPPQRSASFAAPTQHQHYNYNISDTHSTLASTSHHAYPTNQDLRSYSVSHSPYTPTTTTDTVPAPLIAAYAPQNAQQPAVENWNRSLSNAGHIQGPGNLAWQQWTSTVTENLEPPDCYSANALMQLGRNMGSSGGPEHSLDVIGHSTASIDGSVMALAGHMQWPLNIFDMSHS